MSERVNQPPQARTAGLVVERMPEETLVYDPKSEQVHCLNRVATLVWDACDGRTPVPEIRDRLARELSVSVGDDAVPYALGELADKGLLDGPSHQAGEGLSRRGVLAAIGALAVITTLLIPRPSAAQSYDHLYTTV